MVTSATSPSNPSRRLIVESACWGGALPVVAWVAFTAAAPGGKTVLVPLLVFAVLSSLAAVGRRARLENAAYGRAVMPFIAAVVVVSLVLRFVLGR